MSARILAIESSANLCSVAVSGFAAEVCLVSENGEKHTEVLPGMIRRAVTAACGTLGALEAVSFGMGPGAFTGIRVATGLAQGIAWGLDRPLIPVSTLFSLCFEHLETLSEGEVILACVDARMNECYTGAYRLEKGELCEVMAPCLLSPKEVPAAAEDNGAHFLCGNAFAVYKNEMGELGSVLLSSEDVSAAMQIKAAKVLFEKGLTVPGEKALPLYIRNHVAMTLEERASKGLPTVGDAARG